jgi:hypothetical protein
MCLLDGEADLTPRGAARWQDCRWRWRWLYGQAYRAGGAICGRGAGCRWCRRPRWGTLQAKLGLDLLPGNRLAQLIHRSVGLSGILGILRRAESLDQRFGGQPYVGLSPCKAGHRYAALGAEVCGLGFRCRLPLMRAGPCRPGFSCCQAGRQAHQGRSRPGELWRRATAARTAGTGWGLASPCELARLFRSHCGQTWWSAKGQQPYCQLFREAIHVLCRRDVGGLANGTEDQQLPGTIKTQTGDTAPDLGLHMSG